MMKKLYSIYDSVVGEYMPPFIAANETHAARSFMQGLKDVQFPDDFKLFHMGYFDPESGVIQQDLSGDDNPHEVNTVGVFQQLSKMKEGK